MVAGSSSSSGSRPWWAIARPYSHEGRRDHEGARSERGTDAPDVADHTQHRPTAGLADRVRLP